MRQSHEQPVQLCIANVSQAQIESDRLSTHDCKQVRSRESRVDESHAPPQTVVRRPAVEGTRDLCAVEQIALREELEHSHPRRAIQFMLASRVGRKLLGGGRDWAWTDSVFDDVRFQDMRLLRVR